jgi:hypothetical protein
MDDELIHILCQIDRIFDCIINWNYKRIDDMVRYHSLIKNDNYMDDLDYNDEIMIVKEEYLFQLNELITYARALKDKLEND